MEFLGRTAQSVSWAHANEMLYRKKYIHKYYVLLEKGSLAETIKEVFKYKWQQRLH